MKHPRPSSNLSRHAGLHLACLRNTRDPASSLRGTRSLLAYRHRAHLRPRIAQHGMYVRSSVCVCPFRCRQKSAPAKPSTRCRTERNLLPRSAPLARLPHSQPVRPQSVKKTKSISAPILLFLLSLPPPTPVSVLPVVAPIPSHTNFVLLFSNSHPFIPSEAIPSDRLAVAGCTRVAGCCRERCDRRSNKKNGDSRRGKYRWRHRSNTPRRSTARESQHR